ncbi:hypothetical protein C8F01DRAFT_1135290, partial [Mycena amicta]
DAMNSLSSSYLGSTVPPELIHLMGDFLPPSSLSNLTQTCTRLHSILQPVLDARFEQLAWDYRALREILLKAVEKGQADLVKRTLGQDGHDANVLPGRRAGRSDIVGHLLDAGAFPGRRRRPTSSYHGPLPLEVAVDAQQVDSARVLLEHRAEMLEWLLSDAILTGNADMVRLLLDYGANVEFPAKGRKPLGHAAGASPNMRLPPSDLLGWLSEKDEVLSLLMKHGATPMKTIIEHSTELAEAEGITEDEFLVKVKAMFASMDEQ